MSYKTCPECGAHLDPGERCDCQKPDFSELFDFESVTAVYHPQINDGAPVPCFKAGEITDPQLKAWFARSFVSVGELARQQRSASAATTAEALGAEAHNIYDNYTACGAALSNERS